MNTTAPSNKTADLPSSGLPPPPRAEQRPHSIEYHGQTIEDPWAWLRDQGYPNVTDENVLAYLKARRTNISKRRWRRTGR
jgi:protease II